MWPDHRSPEIQYAMNYATFALLDPSPTPPQPGPAWLELRRRIIDLQQNHPSPIPVVHHNIGSPLFNGSSSTLKYDNVFVSELVKAHRRPVNVYPAELSARAGQVNARAGQALAKWERYWAYCEGDWTSERDWAKVEEIWGMDEDICAMTEEFWANLRRFRANVDDGFKPWDRKMFLEEFRHQKAKARAAKLWARERGWATVEEKMASTEQSMARSEQSMVKFEQDMVEIIQARQLSRLYVWGFGFILGGILKFYLF